MLEEYEHAKARGARIYAEFAGFGMSGDAHHITAPPEDGEGAYGSRWWTPCATPASNPDQIHTSMRTRPRRELGDVAETIAIKRAFGDHAEARGRQLDQVHDGPPARRGRRRRSDLLDPRHPRQVLPPTINLENPDPDCDLDYVPNGPPGQLAGGAVELVRLRRHQRHRRLQARTLRAADFRPVDMTGNDLSATNQSDLGRSGSIVVETLWLVNGERTGVDPADRGLAYGDGLFETMAAATAASAGSICTSTVSKTVAGACDSTTRAARPRRGDREPLPACGPCDREADRHARSRYARLRAARGPTDADPLIGAWPACLQPLFGRHPRSRVSPAARRIPALAGMKHLCRLEHVLAHLELRGPDADQGLLLDTSEHVVGGTSGNVFAVSRGQLLTPA